MIEDIEHLNETVKRLLNDRAFLVSSDKAHQLLVEMVGVISSEIICLKDRLSSLENKKDDRVVISEDHIDPKEESEAFK